MTTELVKVVESPSFSGMTVEYLQEVYDGLLAEQGQEVADNFAMTLRSFAGVGGGANLDNIGYGDLGIPDDMFDEDDGALEGNFKMEQDPVRSAKVTQALTKNLPKGVGQGVVIDSLTNTVVAKTWDDDEQRPNKVAVFILAWHQSRVYFEKGNNKPSCSSKDGVINKFGGLCKDCPLRVSQEANTAAPCTNQINAVTATTDLKHVFKLGFSKTSLREGQRLAKLHGALPGGIASVITLSARHEKGDMGSWYIISGQPSPDKATPSMKKALEIISQAYTAYFKRMKESMLQKHHTVKAEGGAKALPGASESIGNSNARLLGSKRPKEAADAYVEPDLSSIGK
jgi:hypothetical protein